MMGYLGQVITAVIAAIICIFAIGILFGITYLFIGHTVNEHGLFLLVFPMAGVSAIAAFGRDESFAALEVIIISAFFAFAAIFSNVAPIMLLFLLAAYVAIYALPVWRGFNYLTVQLPLQRETERQQMLSAKLDQDAELAEAALRHERARAALADAEQQVAAAELDAGRRRAF